MRTIAIIGASNDRRKYGNKAVRAYRQQGYTVYPVNPKADVVHGVVAYPSIEEVPGDVDVAFVVVPAAHVEEIAEQCGRRGVKGLVVISAGFTEIGGEVVERQARLMEICRAHGMRVIGPNCMGIVNTAEDVRLNGTFATVYPRLETNPVPFARSSVSSPSAAAARTTGQRRRETRTSAPSVTPAAGKNEAPWSSVLNQSCASLYPMT